MQHFNRFIPILILFIGCSWYSRGQPQAIPFSLQPSIPVPDWVKKTDWSQPNIYRIDELILDEEKTIKKKKGREEEAPYEVAYNRWKLHLRMKNAILTDGTVAEDEAEYREQLKKAFNESASKEDVHNKTTGNANWTILGPVESFLQGGPKGYDQANVYCVAIAPGNSNVLYCGTETGAVFKSVNKGQSWGLQTLTVIAFL